MINEAESREQWSRVGGEVEGTEIKGGEGEGRHDETDGVALHSDASTDGDPTPSSPSIGIL